MEEEGKGSKRRKTGKGKHTSRVSGGREREGSEQRKKGKGESGGREGKGNTQAE